MDKLTHFDGEGNAVMVDVSGKGDTLREALASGAIRMNREAFEAVAREPWERETCWERPGSRGSWALRKQPS